MPRPLTRAPYRLPAKRKRAKSGIERAPQRIWLRHRKHVRGHHCCAPGCQALAVDVAHLRSVEMGSGTSLKPFEWFTVPLCRHHHQEEEAAGPDAFGDRHGIDLWAIAAELVRRSPDVNMRLAMMEAGLEPDGTLAEPTVAAFAVAPPAPKYRLAGHQPVRTLPFLGYVNSADIRREEVA